MAPVAVPEVVSYVPLPSQSTPHKTIVPSSVEPLPLATMKDPSLPLAVASDATGAWLVGPVLVV